MKIYSFPSHFLPLHTVTLNIPRGCFYYIGLKTEREQASPIAIGIQKNEMKMHGHVSRITYAWAPHLRSRHLSCQEDTLST